MFHGQGYQETKRRLNSEGGILIGRFLFMANPLFIRNLISEPHTRKADTNPVILVSRIVQAALVIWRSFYLHFFAYLQS